MKTYFKTKNGKVLVEGHTNDELWDYEKGEDNIAKMSKKLEEVCDCFIITDVKQTWVQFISLEDARYNWENHDKDLEVYGAIFTKWCIQYVAKMNDKGEFELL